MPPPLAPPSPAFPPHPPPELFRTTAGVAIASLMLCVILIIGGGFAYWAHVQKPDTWTEEPGTWGSRH
eukprot:6261375-Prymnesium_polylepis.1